MEFSNKIELLTFNCLENIFRVARVDRDSFKKRITVNENLDYN
jgi:hypothetical protein